MRLRGLHVQLAREQVGLMEEQAAEEEQMARRQVAAISCADVLRLRRWVLSHRFFFLSCRILPTRRNLSEFESPRTNRSSKSAERREGGKAAESLKGETLRYPATRPHIMFGCRSAARRLCRPGVPTWGESYRTPLSPWSYCFSLRNDFNRICAN
jgi:hypothetical protein